MKKILKGIFVFIGALIVIKISGEIMYQIFVSGHEISRSRAALASGIAVIIGGIFLYKFWIKDELKVIKPKNISSFNSNSNLNKYEQALDEYENNRNKGLYAKIFAEENGDENKVKSRYIKETVGASNNSSLNISEIDEKDVPLMKKPKTTRVRRESELGDDEFLKALIENIKENKKNNDQT